MADGPSVEGLEAPLRTSPMATVPRRRRRPGQEPKPAGNSAAAGAAADEDGCAGAAADVDGSGKAAVGRLSSAGAAAAGVERLRRGRRRLEEEQVGEVWFRFGTISMAAQSETPKHSSISSSNKGEGKISTPSPYKARSVSSCCLILFLSSLALSAWSCLWLVSSITFWVRIGPKCR
ncbi:hypothetical protein ILYODFUR_014395 [Ilyodon furcidens]|uniref:Uncharacterized protein n=1 Tax=Ilyodon furcidens TaxID=33524 RepID=A0ABV0TA99_9TELE